MSNKAIAYALDDSAECLLQLVMSLRSVRRLCKEPMDVYVFTNKPKPWMRNIYGATLVDVGGLVRKYGLDTTGLMWRGGQVPPMLLFRLLLPLVPALQQYDQVLYLDTDTEVWDEKFFKIFSFDKNCELIGIKDSLGQNSVPKRLARMKANMPAGWRDDPGVFNRWEELSDGRGRYANSGVLVFNMKKFDSVEYDKRITYIMDKMRDLKPPYNDQEIVNIYYDIHVEDDRRYNGWGARMSDIYLRHYVGNDRKMSDEYPPPDDRRPTALLDGVPANDKLGVFSGVVDKIYVLVDGAKPANMESLAKWLADTKVTDYVKIDVSRTNKYIGLYNVVPHDEKFNPRLMDNWIGHYKAIADALGNEYEKVAIFEDTFNPNGLVEALPGLPLGFDVALCTDGAGGFKRSHTLYAGSSKGYMVSRKGMVDLRRLFESLWDDSIKTRKLRYVHRWLNKSVLVKARAFGRAN